MGEDVGALFVHKDLVQGQLQLPGEDLVDTGAAEAALAAAHPGVAAALDGVDGPGNDGTVDGVHNLPFGDGFAPADNPAVEGILLHQLGLLLGGEVAEDGALPGVDKFRLFLEGKAASLEKLHRLNADGRGGGQAGGLDAAQVDEALGGGGFLDDEVVLIGVCTNPGEVPDGIPEVDPGHRLYRHPADKAQAGGGVVDIVGLLYALGVGADNEVAVNRGSHQNALAVLIGALENDLVHKAALGLVQEEIFPAVGEGGEAVAAYHGVDLVGVYAGCVDDILGLHIPGGGM